MLKIEAVNIKKYYSDRLILDIENLKIYKDERIGIVGLNGSGKTTLMNILSKRTQPDEGFVKQYGKYDYITQLDAIDDSHIDPKIASEFGIRNKDVKHLSGGEKTRLKIAKCFSKNNEILFADEPTNNLDMKGIKILEERLKTFNGAILLISHDRQLLNNICNKIIEVHDGKIKEYNGNYDDYKYQKKMEKERKQFEYNQYIIEKKKIKNAIVDRNQRSANMKKTPTRMGISEARLHKRSTSARQAKLYQATNALHTRLEKLEKKEKPKSIMKAQIDIPAIGELHSKIVISGDGISKAYGDRVLFKKVDFQIYNGEKVALIGDNGTGKTTLIRMILDGMDNIKLAKKARIAYFSQELDILEEGSTILENVMENSIHSETFVRTLLARLLFRREDVTKKINVLSGGEKVKVAFAKIFVQDVNLIILDEPTNFLDVHSIESLEEVLHEYEGTLLFVSHDRSFIDKIANKLLILENQTLTMFTGNYMEYLNSKDKLSNNNQEKNKGRLLILKNRLSEIISKLSINPKDEEKESLDKEFNEIINEINLLKK